MDLDNILTYQGDFSFGFLLSVSISKRARTLIELS